MKLPETFHDSHKGVESGHIWSRTQFFACCIWGLGSNPMIWSTFGGKHGAPSSKQPPNKKWHQTGLLDDINHENWKLEDWVPKAWSECPIQYFAQVSNLNILIMLLVWLVKCKRCGMSTRCFFVWDPWTERSGFAKVAQSTFAGCLNDFSNF